MFVYLIFSNILSNVGDQKKYRRVYFLPDFNVRIPILLEHVCPIISIYIYFMSH